MKKYILFVMAIVLSMSVFVGCGPTKTHKEVKTEIDTFLADTKYSNLINANFSYSAKIENKMATDSDFSVLDTYEQLADFSLVILENTYQSFTISPLNKSKTSGEKCGAVVSALDKVKSQYETFSNAKNVFEANIEHLDIDGTVAKAELSVFKKEFGKLVDKLGDLNNAYENAYTALYGGVKEITNDSGKVKNAVISVFSDLLNCYVNYSICEFKYEYQTISDAFMTNLYNLKTNLETQTPSAEKYAEWYGYYELFKGEVKVFNSSLKKINLNNFPANPSAKQEVYKHKVDNFIQTNAGIFMQKTISLLY